MDSQPQSPGWSPTIPSMATHHPKIEICQNEAYYNYRLGIWHLDLIPKIKIR